MGEAEAVRPELSVRRLVDAVLSVVLAPACAACATPLDQPTRGIVCAACWASVGWLPAPLCDRCGVPVGGSERALDSPDPPRSCGRCARRPPLVSRARAAGAYSGALREIVHAFKYSRRRSLAGPLAALIRERAGDLLDGADVAVPVPLHPSRERERGFNQAELLARELRVPLRRLLVRTRATASQIDLPAERRHANVRGAFALARNGWPFRAKPPGPLPRTILLVDDVATTGATLNECARVLLEGGVQEVRAVTVARAL